MNPRPNTSRVPDVSDTSWYRAPEWREREKLADEQVARGEYVEYATPMDAVAALLHDYANVRDSAPPPS